MKAKILFVVALTFVMLLNACSPVATPTAAPVAPTAPAATNPPAPADTAAPAATNTVAAPAPAATDTAAPAASGKPFRIAVIMPSAITDLAFSQSMWTALQSVQKEMGGPSALDIKFTDNMFNVPDATNAIRDYASQGFDIVIAHGSQYGSAVQEIAKDFPEVTFAWGTDVNTFGLPNVYAYTAAAEEGGYVNGVLAAKLTKSKIIGVTGPVEVGRCQNLHRWLCSGRSLGRSIHQSQQDLDRLLLGRGPDD